MRKLIRILLPLLTVLALAGTCALAEEMDDGLLLLASSSHPLPADYVPDNLKQMTATNRGVHLVTSRSTLLREDALEAFYVMMRAADNDGVTLYVRQAYRSYADEQRRYELLSGSGQVAQKPGESSYQTGLSVTLVGEAWRTGDLTAEFAQSVEARWLSEHAAAYGFVQRYPQGKEDVTGWIWEPWHYRYVGVAAAQLMSEQNLCLEELAADSGLLDLMPEDTALPEVEDPVDEGEEEPEFEMETESEPETEFEPEPVTELEPEPAAPSHPVPPVYDLSQIDPEDIGPDGDFEISIFDM